MINEKAFFQEMFAAGMQAKHCSAAELHLRNLFALQGTGYVLQRRSLDSTMAARVVEENTGMKTSRVLQVPRTNPTRPPDWMTAFAADVSYQAAIGLSCEDTPLFSEARTSSVLEGIAPEVQLAILEACSIHLAEPVLALMYTSGAIAPDNLLANALASPLPTVGVTVKPGLHGRLRRNLHDVLFFYCVALCKGNGAAMESLQRLVELMRQSPIIGRKAKEPGTILVLGA